MITTIDAKELNDINRRLEAIENKLEKTEETLRKASSILDFMYAKLKYTY